MRLHLAAPLLLLVALANPVGAEHCTTWSTSTTNESVLVVEASAFFFDYVAIDLCQPDCAFSIWPYFEANGIPGLQRADHVVDDTCHGMIAGDAMWA